MLEEDEGAIRQLRKRAKSDLLSVAMFGGSSSGKSFLASALLGGLEFLRVDSVEGVPSDKYLGLLPVCDGNTDNHVSRASRPCQGY